MYSICNSASNYLKSFINPALYGKYKTFIATNTTKFINSQHLLLNEIFKTKHNAKPNTSIITYKEIDLDNTNKIPPFIEIFKYLINKSEFYAKFSPEEQTLLKHLEHLTNKECYKFLEENKLGQKLIDTYYSSYNIFSSELKAKFPSVQFHSLLINSFTSFKIIETLETKITKLISFSIKWKGKQLDNLVYVFMYEDYFAKGNFEKIGNEIIKRILFFNDFLNIDTLPNKFIIFLTDNKKEIDNDVIKHMYFKTINVNTAVTNGRDIIIYREQELLKSIFHELIHFHNLDYRDINDNIIQYLINTHNIKSDNEYLIYECITESLANILNNIYMSGTLKEFKSNLQNEILFSTLQVAKLLNVCKYKQWNEFTRIDNDFKVKPNKFFKQDSCVMSYYILKFYIMLNLDTYFKKCLDGKLKFIQTTDNFTNLMNIFDLSRKNLILKKIMDNLLKNNKLSKFNITKKNTMKNTMKNTIKNKISKTLRMTCIESHLFSKNSI